MEDNQSKKKIKITYIIIPVLLVISIVELVLLLKPNKELSKSTKINYDEEFRLGDILFDSDDVGYDNTNSGLTSTTVQDAIDELYTAANTCVTNLATCQASLPQVCSNSPFNLGDYIDMTPTSSSYSVSQNLRSDDGSATAVTLNPSELNVWRVININPDCTVEVVSEYVSTQNVEFKAKNGFLNYVYVLNEIAKQYANTTYTLDTSTAPDGAFRNVGYDGQTKQITDLTRIDDTTLGEASGAWYQKTTSFNGEESKGGGDQKYVTDLKLIEDAGASIVAFKKGTTSLTAYWLVSRRFYWDSTTNWNFGVRYVSVGGVIHVIALWNRYYGIFDPGYSSYAIRPIVTLKSGLTTSSGNGTASSHYQLSAS